MGIAKGFQKKEGKPTYSPPKLEVNVFFNQGGLGDYICRIPVLTYLLTNHKHLTLHVWVPDFFLDLAEHFLCGYENCIVKPFSKAKTELIYGIQALDSASKHHSSMRTHLVTHGFNMYADMMPSLRESNYPQLRLEEIELDQITPLPEKYIILTTGYTAPIREWVPKSVNETAKWCKDNGYEVVWLGSKSANAGNGGELKGYFNEGIDYSIGIDLIGDTTLLEASKILAGAQAVVGIDNGLLHLAGCSQVPIVFGCTSVRPEQRLPIRNTCFGWNCEPVVADNNCCGFSQSDLLFIPHHDYKTCYFKKYGCTTAMKSELFIESLKKIL
jgi:ADP-heptose:LPS heptosyltransferase